MATARPFSYNDGAPIGGTIQIGDLAIGTPTSGFTNNPQFWNGPDEELGYVIAYPDPSGQHPTPISGVTAFLGFVGTKNMVDPFSESTFLQLTNSRFNQNLTSGNEASDWLTTNGYWNSWVIVTPTPTATNTPTPTKTLSLIGTFTVTNSHPTLIVQNVFYGTVQSPTFTSGSFPILPSQTAINNTTNFSPGASWGVGVVVQVGIIGGGSGSGYLSIVFDGCIVFSLAITSSSNIGVSFTPTCNGVTKPLLSNTIVEYIISESIDPFVTPTPTTTPTITL